MDVLCVVTLNYLNLIADTQQRFPPTHTHVKTKNNLNESVRRELSFSSSLNVRRS